MKIAVIGAGITGLTLAYVLNKQGHAVTLYEAGSKPGGELATVKVGGEPIERFYHHLFTHDHFMIQLCRELGIEDRLQWHEPLMAFYAGGRIYPFTSPVDLMRFGYLSPAGRLRLGLSTLMLQRRKDHAAFEDVTAAELMPKFTGREAFEKIFKPLLRAKFDRHWESVSMAWMWARLMSRARTRTPDKRRERLGYFDGGFGVVVDALARALADDGVSIHLRSPVETVSIGSEGAPALRAGGQAVVADAVVATVGLPIIRRILPDDWREFTDTLAATDYVGACVVLMEIEQQLSKYYWTSIGDGQLPFAGLVEHTNMVDPSRYGGQRLLYVSNYLPPEHEFFTIDDDALVARLVDPIRRVFPNFTRDQIGRSWVSRDRVAQPVITAGYQRRKPAYRSPVPGFYICNTSQIYPEDRGTNYNVRIARECAAVLEADARSLCRN